MFDNESRSLFVTGADGVTLTNSDDARGWVALRTHPESGVAAFSFDWRAKFHEAPNRRIWGLSELAPPV